LAFHAALPGDGPEAVPTELSFRVLVKDVKEKRLPDPTDDWAAESSEFSTLGELRDDLRTRLARVKVLRTRMAVRENAMASLAELVTDDEVPAVLVDDEVQHRVHDLGHRLEEQRITIDQFLAATGRSGDDLVAEVRQDAHRSVKADLALRALADAEALEVTEEDLDIELAAMASRLEMDPKALREQLDRGGRTAAVRSEQRKAKALTWLVDHVELVDEAGNPVSRDEFDQAMAAEGEETGEASDDDSEASTGETDT
jgi:trigger factor